MVTNDERIKILRSESINIFSKNLYNVLHVQKCFSNLLFINKISQEINCYFFIKEKDFFFPDWMTGNIIGEGFLENELYILEEEKDTSNVKKEEELGTL
jgi:hypothetical protein